MVLAMKTKLTDTAEVRRLKAHIRRLERALRDAEERELSFREVEKTIFGLAAAPHNKLTLLSKEEPPAVHAPGTPVLCLSDWHVGEVVKSTETGGINAFNNSILERRVKKVLASTVDIANNHMTNPKYPEIVTPLLGDFVSGEIHDELTRTNDLSVFQSILRAADLLTNALVLLASVFGKVRAPAVCGNHGRADKKFASKTFTFRNADWLIYQIVRARLQEAGLNDKVIVSVDETNEALFDVHGTRFLAVHGHDLGVKGGDGIIGPLGPIMRGRLKMEAQQAAQGRRFDVLLMGHWHFDVYLPGTVVCGTLKGYDEFAKSALRAKPVPPSQTLFFVHPSYGITSHWRIFAERHTMRRR
jgi:predicted phosphodiesterase